MSTGFPASGTTSHDNETPAMRISLIDLISALSGALDLVSPAVVGHHRRVAAIAMALGRRLSLPPADITDLRLAALLHDVGAFSLKSRLDALVFDTTDLDHAETGWRLLRSLPRLERPARLVRWHHTRFDDFGDILDDPRTLLLGNLLNLADRVDVSLRRDRDLDTEARATIRRIGMLRGRSFDPEALRALDDTLSSDALDPEFWHGAVRDSRCLGDCLELALEDGEIPVFSRAFSQVIDFRSRFTATHSRGVATVAHALAGLEGLPEDIRARVLLAGDLHDLGKLAVPTEILEKPGPLDPREAEIMRRHAEIGERVLSQVPGLEEVAEFGCRHHERPNGRGYPRGLAGGQLRQPSLLVAAADVFTAVLEDRPYRPGMTLDSARSLLRTLADGGDLDPRAVDLLLTHTTQVDEARRQAQDEAHRQFTAFAPAFAPVIAAPFGGS
ncbi:HD domain-containing phosphohydrolase [Desulfovibrio aminophilus]|uniref:HD-GYP domain-containing protein n=1 Tax=Desulfovibrio aminophilus TaxID=81425 RepID=UPI00339B4225